MIDAINRFFGSILSAFDSFTGHYLLALFLFALMIKIILCPFGIKQQKNSVKQARLKPKEMAIRSKYKGRTDQPTMQKMQNEIMDLYQKEGYNPMGGCLPMLIQLPIIMILYGIVYNPLKYICKYSTDMLNGIANFVNNDLGIALKNFKDGVFSGRDIDLVQYLTQDHLEALNASLGDVGQVVLSDLPNFSHFGDPTALAKTPSWTTWLVLIPLLNFVFTVLSSFISRKLTFQPMQDNAGSGKQMMIMTVIMSAVTAWLAFSFPAALGIYWIFNTLLGMLQQFILYKAIPLPKFTEEDYKAAEREYLGKAAKKENLEKTKAALARPMDDDEYADLGTYSSIYDERAELINYTDTQSKEGDENSVIKKSPLKIIKISKK